jgi:uncharacterized protein YjbI with pentapeptide repeats
VTPQTIVLILEQHARWLRNKSDGARADISFQDLSGLQLPHAIFRRAKLAGVNFSNAELTGCDFSETDLFAANLQDATLRHVNFEGVDLHGAQFSNADLSQANLQITDMREGRLMQSGAQTAQPHPVKSGRACCDVKNATLRGANLSHANMTKCSLVEADLSGALLQSARMREFDLDGAMLKNADMTNVDLSAARLSGCNLEAANPTNAIVRDVDFAKANIRGANLEGVDMMFANTQPGSANVANADEFNAILDQHTAWIDSLDTSGERAIFDDWDLSSAQLAAITSQAPACAAPI